GSISRGPPTGSVPSRGSSRRRRACHLSCVHATGGASEMRGRSRVIPLLATLLVHLLCGTSARAATDGGADAADAADATADAAPAEGGAVFAGGDGPVSLDGGAAGSAPARRDARPPPPPAGAPTAPPAPPTPAAPHARPRRIEELTVV